MLDPEGTRLSCGQQPEKGAALSILQKNFNVFAGECHAMSDFLIGDVFFYQHKARISQLLFGNFAGRRKQSRYIIVASSTRKLVYVDAV